MIKTELTADGQTDTRYFPRETKEIEWKVVRAWRKDARFCKATVEPTYKRYVFRGPRMTDLAVVKVFTDSD